MNYEGFTDLQNIILEINEGEQHVTVFLHWSGMHLNTD
jgi:hypothetical protein